MINQIHIIGYQSHEDTCIDLAPGINVFIGASDVGKTGILRAFNWVANNRPMGDSFRRWGTKETSVKLLLSEGSSIERLKKGTTENLYRLTAGDDVQTFRALGKEVPQEIQDVLNMGSINWQWQMDAPFLLSLSSGEVARQLNDIVNLDVIDTTESNINKKARTARQEQKTLQARLEDLQEQLAEPQYAQLEDLEKSLAVLEKKKAEQEEMQEAVEDLSKLLTGVERSAAVVGELRKALKYASEVEELIVISKQMAKLDQSFKALDTMCFQIQSTEESIASVRRTLDQLNKEYHEATPADICPLCGQEIVK